MASYIIEGGRKLEGEVDISGAKNSALPIIAGTILNGGISKLYNVPNIHDTKMMFRILEELGCKVKKDKNKYIIDSSKLNSCDIPEDLMREMRSSVIIAGALIGKNRKACFSCPGGCDIGSRPIDLHLKAFKELGININEDSGRIECSADNINGSKIRLDFPSVGATENIILSSVLAEGETTIINAAMEPEIVDLQNFLNRMGAKIAGAGSNVIVINGVKKLKDVSYNIIPDRIEAGTFLCMTAINGGEVKLNNVISEHIEPVIQKLEDAGCKLNIIHNGIELKAPKRLRAVDIKTMPYPGFPTDMQSIFGTIMTVAKGTSIVIENIFENRFKYLDELSRMGAKYTIEGRTAIIKGVRKLNSANVRAKDLRGGISLVIAGMYANGKTKVDNIEYILRGYDNLDNKIRSLGGRIQVYNE